MLFGSDDLVRALPSNSYIESMSEYLPMAAPHEMMFRPILQRELGQAANEWLDVELGIDDLYMKHRDPSLPCCKNVTNIPAEYL